MPRLKARGNNAKQQRLEAKMGPPSFCVIDLKWRLARRILVNANRTAKTLLISLVLLATCVQHSKQALAHSSVLSSSSSSVPFFKTSFLASSDNPTMQRRNGALLSSFQLAPSALAPQLGEQAEQALGGGGQLAEAAPAGLAEALVAVPRARQSEGSSELQQTSGASGDEDLLAVSSTQMSTNSTTIQVDSSPTNASEAAFLTSTKQTTTSTNTSETTTSETKQVKSSAESGGDFLTPNSSSKSPIATTSEPEFAKKELISTSTASTTTTTTTMTTTVSETASENLQASNVTTTPRTSNGDNGKAAATTQSGAPSATQTAATTSAPATQTHEARMSTETSTELASGPQRSQEEAVVQQQANFAPPLSGSFVVGSVPVLESAPQANKSGSLWPARIATEFVFVPAEEMAPLVLDESSFANTSASVPSDTSGDSRNNASAPAEHRALDGATGDDDLELDYMNMEPSPMGDDAPLASARLGGQPAATSSTTSTTRRPTTSSAEGASGSSSPAREERLARISSAPLRTIPSSPLAGQASAASSTSGPQLQLQFQSTRRSVETTTRRGAQLAPEATTVAPAATSTTRRPLAASAAQRASAPTTTSTGRPTTRRSKVAHRAFYSEPVEGDWRRRKASPARAAYSPVLNGADEEEADILARYSAPSQLTRLSAASVRSEPPQSARRRGNQPIPTTTTTTTTTTTSTTTRRPEPEQRGEPLAGQSVRSSLFSVEGAMQQAAASPRSLPGGAPTTTTTESSAGLAARLEAAGEPGELMLTLIASSIIGATQSSRSAEPVDSSQAAAAPRNESLQSTTSATSTSSTTSTTTSTSTTSRPSATPANKRAQSTGNAAPAAGSQRGQPKRSHSKPMANAYSPATQGQQKSKRTSKKAHLIDGATTPNEKQYAGAQPAQFDSGQWRPDTHVDYSESSEQARATETKPHDSTQSHSSKQSLPGRPGLDYPIHWQVPRTSFDCRNYEQSGFYADVESDCQAYHSCHRGRGGRHTFLCPNGTLFSQELLTCDWWYNVECSASKLYMPNGDNGGGSGAMQPK